MDCNSCGCLESVNQVSTFAKDDYLGEFWEFCEGLGAKLSLRDNFQFHVSPKVQPHIVADRLSQFRSSAWICDEKWFETEFRVERAKDMFPLEKLYSAHFASIPENDGVKDYLLQCMNVNQETGYHPVYSFVRDLRSFEMGPEKISNHHTLVLHLQANDADPGVMLRQEFQTYQLPQLLQLETIVVLWHDKASNWRVFMLRLNGLDVCVMDSKRKQREGVKMLRRGELVIDEKVNDPMQVQRSGDSFNSKNVDEVVRAALQTSELVGTHEDEDGMLFVMVCFF